MSTNDSGRDERIALGERISTWMGSQEADAEFRQHLLDTGEARTRIGWDAERIASMIADANRDAVAKLVAVRAALVSGGVKVDDCASLEAAAQVLADENTRRGKIVRLAGMLLQPGDNGPELIGHRSFSEGLMRASRYDGAVDDGLLGRVVDHIRADERSRVLRELEDPKRRGGPKRPAYVPTNAADAVGYLIEECSEVLEPLVERIGKVLKAAGKMIRFGPGSSNLELPVGQRETNARWLMRECDDLDAAIAYTRTFVRGDAPPAPPTEDPQ